MEGNKFDFNFIIGFLLIGLLFFFMINSFESTHQIDNNQINLKEEIDLVEEEIDLVEEEIDLVEENPENTFSNKVAEIKTILKNNDLEIQFSNKCGCFEEVKLITKNGNLYRHQYNGEPIEFISKKNSDSPPIKLITSSNRKQKSSNNQFFIVDTSSIKKGKIRYEHSSSDYTLEYILVGKELQFNIINNKKKVSLYWDVNGPRQEKNLDSGFTSERNSSNVYYSDNNGKWDRMSYTGDDEKDDFDKPMSWIGYKQQFFSTIISSNSDFKVNYIKIKGGDLDSTIVKRMTSKISIKKSKKTSFSFYFLPNNFNLLKNHDSTHGAGFENLVELGWGPFRWVNQFLVIPIFDFLEGKGLGYGIIILVIAIVFKMLLFFPTKKSYVSMAKMRVLKPEIDAINEKYKDKDPLEKQKAQMDLYKRTGVSPLGGCLPMLLQIPILFALFRFFPASIQLRQQSFLWADDLSTYDSVLEFSFLPGIFDHLSLFALLMSLSTVVQMRFNAQPTNNQMPQLKYIMYIMPVVFFFIMNNYSAGLSYYYLLANVITFLQQLYIKRKLDDKTLYAELQANKNKPIKKSNWQKKLEEIARQQKRRKKR